MDKVIGAISVLAIAAGLVLWLLEIQGAVWALRGQVAECQRATAVLCAWARDHETAHRVHLIGCDPGQQ